MPGLSALDLRAKVAQLVFPSFFGDGRDIDRALELAGAGVGGFVLYEGTSPAETAELVARLREASSSEFPLIVSADQENGAGQVVKGATELPPQMAFSAAGCPELMRKGACLAATEGSAMGFDLNYAPVADFTAFDTGPVEGGRSFGGDLTLIEPMLAAYVAGYREGGMGTTAKHFPGRGGVVVGREDPWWAEIAKPAERVRAEDWAAFALAIRAGVDFVMTEHISVPEVTGDTLPACVSRALVTDELRVRLGFGGVITSDDLWYDPVCDRFGAEEVGVLALEAGHDALLKPRDPLATIDHVLAAIASGRLTEARIDESLTRLLRFKERIANRPALDPERAAAVAGCAEHLALAQEVSDRAVVLLANRDGAIPLSPERLSPSAPLTLVTVIRFPNDPVPAEVEKQLRARFPGREIRVIALATDTTPEDALREQVLASARESSLVLLSISVSRARMADPAPLGAAKPLLEELTAAVPAIVLAHGNPWNVAALPACEAGLVGWGEGGWFGNRFLAISSMLRILSGELAPKGRLPIEVGSWPSGHGLS